MEKRQAIILLVLVLVVSLASFTLGVIVGRRGAERDLAQKAQQTERVLVAQAPASTTAIPIHVSDVDPVAGAETKSPAAEETKLTFYDNLSKETAPLGSGINLEPIEEKVVPAENVVQPPIDLPDQPIVKKEQQEVASVVKKEVPRAPAEVEPSQSEKVMPKMTSSGSHAVQVGSFGAAGDAIALKKKMLSKDYPAFVVEADLGAKGLWYRVRIGPYESSEVAKSAQKVLEDKEQLKGFITRQ